MIQHMKRIFTKNARSTKLPKMHWNNDERRSSETSRHSACIIAPYKQGSLSHFTSPRAQRLITLAVEFYWFHSVTSTRCVQNAPKCQLVDRIMHTFECLCERGKSALSYCLYS